MGCRCSNNSDIYRIKLIPISAEYLNQEVAFRLLENSRANADYLTPSAVLETLWALYGQYILAVNQCERKILSKLAIKRL